MVFILIRKTHVKSYFNLLRTNMKIIDIEKQRHCIMIYDYSDYLCYVYVRYKNIVQVRNLALGSPYSNS